MTAKFLVCDVFDGLATLGDGSVDLVITSPPFLALRSYLPADHPDKGKEIGSESTPAAFLDVMFRFTAELRRVLAPHGSIAIELGDTYAGGPLGFQDGDKTWRPNSEKEGGRWQENGRAKLGDGWPLSKSKTLIPELYRIGLAYGINPLTGEQSPAGKWRVRNVVTWARPNPPVGALGDKWRPATSDVVIACLSGKRFWDDLATRKPHQVDPATRAVQHRSERSDIPELLGAPSGDAFSNEGHPSGAPLLDYWEIPLDGSEPKPYGPKPPKPDKTRTVQHGGAKGDPNGGRDTLGPYEGNQNPAGSPLLDYWEIPPTGYSGSHYAVFPPALVEPLVKAMTPSKVCRVCGEPSRRIVEHERVLHKEQDEATTARQVAAHGKSLDNFAAAHGGKGYSVSTETLGFTDCGHDSWRPGLILDCFGGSGTTGVVATGHGHECVLIDIDERNCELARERIGPLMFEGPIYLEGRQDAAPQSLVGES